MPARLCLPKAWLKSRSLGRTQLCFGCCSAISSDVPTIALDGRTSGVRGSRHPGGRSHFFTGKYEQREIPLGGTQSASGGSARVCRCDSLSLVSVWLALVASASASGDRPLLRCHRQIFNHQPIGIGASEGEARSCKSPAEAVGIHERMGRLVCCTTPGLCGSCRSPPSLRPYAELPARAKMPACTHAALDRPVIILLSRRPVPLP